jgi:hypothetical protein
VRKAARSPVAVGIVTVFAMVLSPCVVPDAAPARHPATRDKSPATRAHRRKKEQQLDPDEGLVGGIG